MVVKFDPMSVAIIAGIVYMLQISVCFNILNIIKRAKFMLLLWLANLPILIAAYVWLTQHDMLSAFAQQSNLFMGIAVTLFFYAAGFFGGILQLYNLADRGFSLRVLIDIYEQRNSGVTVQDVSRSYSAGKGVAWMYQKRIDGMLNSNLIRIDNTLVSNTAKGTRLTKVFILMRKIYNLE